MAELVTASRGRRAARDAEVAARRVRVLQLRQAGFTFAQIADQLRPAGMSYTAAHAAQDAQRALAGRKRELADLAGLHITLELERLDERERAVRRVQTQAQQGRITGDDGLLLTPREAGRLILACDDRLGRIAAARGRLLGLDNVAKPARDTPTTPAGPGTGQPGMLADLAARRARRRAEQAGRTG